MKHVHILTEINKEARTAICANCGPTPLRSIGVDKWRCGTYKRQKDKEWRERNPEAVATYMETYYQQNKEMFRNSALKSRYGITNKEYETLLSSQGGVCKICGGPPAGTGARNGHFHVDHCHDTLVIRGILCGKCNVGLGSFGSDSALLRKAIEYLDR